MSRKILGMIDRGVGQFNFLNMLINNVLNWLTPKDKAAAVACGSLRWAILCVSVHQGQYSWSDCPSGYRKYGTKWTEYYYDYGKSFNTPGGDVIWWCTNNPQPYEACKTTCGF